MSHKERCNMLLEFQVENYLSFKEKTTLSMAAFPLKELKEAVFKKGKYKLLSSAAVFGANASGKSNLIKSIKFMKDIIINSSQKKSLKEDIPVSNFKLSKETLYKPSTFEMTFILEDELGLSNTGNIVYRYGFQVDKEMVKSEWLFARFTGKESRLFTRLGNEIKIGEKFNEGKQIYKALGKIKKSSLFLSQIATIKGENAPITNEIINWFDNLKDISPIADNNFFPITVEIMKSKKYKEKVLRALMLADICVEDIVINEEKLDLGKLPENAKMKLKSNNLKNEISLTIDTIHNVYNNENKKVDNTLLNFEEEESDGSKKFFAIIGPIISALDNGFILVIDEIDARLHPNLCLLIISLFNSKKTNPKGSQLIFATHNTLIMDKRFLRRDQIYLIEKDRYGASELYSLIDFKSVRNDSSYNKDYLMGKYGAVPYLGNFELLFPEGK